MTEAPLRETVILLDARSSNRADCLCHFRNTTRQGSSAEHHSPASLPVATTNFGIHNVSDSNRPLFAIRLWELTTKTVPALHIIVMLNKAQCQTVRKVNLGYWWMLCSVQATDGGCRFSSLSRSTLSLRSQNWNGHIQGMDRNLADHRVAR